MGVLDWILLALFGIGGVYSLAGNFALYYAIRSNGSGLPFVLSGATLFLYFRESSGVRTRPLDLFALSLVFALLIAIISAILLRVRLPSS